MNFTLVKSKQLKPEAFLLPVKKDLVLCESICSGRKALFDQYVQAGLFKGEAEELVVMTKTCEDHYRYVILLGLGDDFTDEDLADALAKGALKAQELEAKTVTINLDNIEADLDAQKVVRSLVAFGAAEYSFDLYRAKKTTRFETVEVILKNDEAQDWVKEASILVEATSAARDLVNEPANVLKPVELANRAKKLGQEAGFEVEVKGKAEIEALGMKAYLAVASGADSEPQLIVMRYSNGGSQKPFALVGKGLTYDTGGYSLKPSTSMDTMKTDMGGSAAVIGAMVAIAKAKLPVNVVAVVAACENMVSGHAIFPGDVVGSMCGKFIEVKNTDAEGRLTLIDAVTYALEKEGADRVLDIATLTGAQIVALGDLYAGVLGNNAELMAQLKEAADLSGDAVWEMPYNKKVAKRNESKIGDIMNIGNVPGMGCSVAGAFVGEAIEGQPWVHVDIAGPSYFDSPKSTIKAGATGFGVGLIYQLIKLGA